MPELPLRSDRTENIEDGHSLGEYLGIFWARRSTILSCGLGALLLGVAYSWVATPVFQVNAMLQVEAKKSAAGNSSLAALTEGLFEVSPEAQAEVEILGSNLVLGRTVEELHLDVVTTPILTPLVGAALARGQENPPRLEVEFFDVPSSLFGKLFRVVDSGDRSFMLLDPKGKALAKGRPGQELIVKFLGQPLRLKVRNIVGSDGQRFLLVRRSINRTIERLRRNLSVAEKGKQTNIIALSLLHPNPTEGAAILNSILGQYIRQNIERKAEEASKTLGFLQDQMPLVKGQLEVAEERLNHYRAGLGVLDLSEEAKVMLQQSALLEGQILALQQKKQEVQRTYQDHTSVVVTLDQQLEKLQGEARRMELQAKGLPFTQQEVVRLMRDVQVNQEIYSSMMNNAQQLQVAKAGEIGSARVVDYASPSWDMDPVAPVVPKVLGLSILLGVFIGVGIVLIHRALHRGVENPEIIEAKLGLPVLATVLHSDQQVRITKVSQRPQNEAQLLALTHPEDVAIECLRSLHTSLQFLTLNASNNAIMLTGPAPGIGKSFLSGNLASLMATAGRRILLVDADLHKGKMHRRFAEMKRHGGLSEVLSGKMEWRSVLFSANGLDIISTGEIPINPAELLRGERFAAFMEETCAAYDFVIFDTPPVLAVTDAAIIGAMVGTTLLCLKAGEHPLEEIREALRRFENSGITVKGAIFNDMPQMMLSYGYHRYAYHYQYGKEKT